MRVSYLRLRVSLTRVVNEERKKKRREKEGKKEGEKKRGTLLSFRRVVIFAGAYARIGTR